ncbi:MAG TPA: metalloregulator ArsR/SmtB family transcription factor [Chloroflexota bacterium]|nr:metalloregulator ArsR/SmtB family transcription factor [Chloroflexota bacterium]
MIKFRDSFLVDDGESPDSAVDLDQLRDAMTSLHARFCRGLGDPKRLLIIVALRSSEKSVSQLAKEIGASQSNASQHLGLMRDLELVTARRVENNVFYRLSDPRLADAVDLLRAIQIDQQRGEHATRTPDRNATIAQTVQSRPVGG